MASHLILCNMPAWSAECNHVIHYKRSPGLFVQIKLRHIDVSACLVYKNPKIYCSSVNIFYNCVISFFEISFDVG